MSNLNFINKDIFLKITILITRLNSRLNKMKGVFIIWQIDLKKFPRMQHRGIRSMIHQRHKRQKEVMKKSSLTPKSLEGEKENGTGRSE